MRESVLMVCNRVNGKVDYTRTDLIDGGYLDSVTLVEIASELMDEFDIEIPYEEIMPENFNSIDAMTALVEKYV
jgi:acyl carrier protein